MDPGGGTERHPTWPRTPGRSAPPGPGCVSDAEPQGLPAWVSVGCPALWGLGAPPAVCRDGAGAAVLGEAPVSVGAAFRGWA